MHGAEGVVDVDVGRARRAGRRTRRARRRPCWSRPASKRTFSSSSDVAVGRAPATAAGRVLADRRRRRAAPACRAARRAARRPGAARTPARARPSGGPRWAATMTRAPASSSACSVGRLARIRPSSVIAPVALSSGTFRSERTSTRRPRRPRRRSSSGSASSERRAPTSVDEVDEAVGVAPLVVVPADDLDLVADDLGQPRVEDARRRVGDDVGGDDRVLGVAQVALERALGGGLDRRR